MSAAALAVAEPGGEHLRCAAEPIDDPLTSGRIVAELVQRLGAQRANCVLVAAPDAYHLMLIGLKRALTPGQTVNLTLEFERAGRITTRAEVR